MGPTEIEKKIPHFPNGTQGELSLNAFAKSTQSQECRHLHYQVVFQRGLKGLEPGPGGLTDMESEATKVTQRDLKERGMEREERKDGGYP